MTVLQDTPLHVGTDGARTALRSAGELTGPGIARAVARLIEPTRTVAGYHFGWWDRDARPTRTEAREDICAALVLAAARAAGARPGQAVAAATAVELVHNFAMLHEDVLEGNLTRSGRPTAWSVFGRTQAILAGDALLVLGLDQLTGRAAGADAPAAELSAALLEMVAAAGADHAFEERPDADLAERLEMTVGRAAALFGGACALGAMSAGAGPARVDLFRQFGHHIGLAAQLADDLQAMRAAADAPVRAGARLRKRSMLVVAALTSYTRAGRRLGGFYHRPEPLDVTETREVAQLVERAGGVRWVEQAAARQRARALESLADLDPVTSGQLRELAALAADRGYQGLGGLVAH
ncbi:polyprenyl synthetase family protein [Kitasatospora sp. NPDC004531]